MDPDERLEVLDAEGIDAAVLYTTVGLLWEAELDDPELCQAYTRAYNRWICEFCADSAAARPDRAPVAERSGRPRPRSSSGPSARAPRARTSRRSPTTAGRSAIPTTTRCSPPRRTSTCRSPSIPTFEPQWTKGTRMGTWENVKQLRLLASVHGVRRRAPPVHDAVRLRRVRQVPAAEGRSCSSRAAAGSATGSTASTPSTATRSSAHACRSSTSRATTSASGCGSRCDPDERTIPALAERFGADRFMWASDFPHADHTPEYVARPRRARRRRSPTSSAGAVPRRQRPRSCSEMRRVNAEADRRDAATSDDVDSARRACFDARTVRAAGRHGR